MVVLVRLEKAFRNKSFNALFFASFLYSQAAYTQSVICNREQSQCEFESKDFTIGDEVEIFSTEGDLVAKGIIRTMDLRKRTVRITKKFGPIKPGSVLKLATPGNSGIRVYKAPSKFGVGADVSVGSANIGSGTTMLGLEGMGYMRWLYEIEFGARIGYTSFDGQVTRSYESEPTQTVAFTGGMLGVLGNAGYTAMKREPVSFRGEANLGFCYMMASVNGRPGDVDGAGYRTRVSNGFGLLARLYAGALYNRNEWQFGLGANLGLLQGTTFWSGSLGVLREIN